MISEPYFAAYRERLLRDAERYAKDYVRLKETAQERGYTYRGKPIPFAYQPLWIAEEDEGNFSDIVEATSRIVRKVTDRYVEDASYRRLFPFSRALEELISIDPGYAMPAPMARFDVFYRTGEDFQFCEINTDGSSAMLEDRRIGELLMQSEIAEDLRASGWRFSLYELFQSWVRTVEEIYAEARGARDGFSVAIVDRTESSTPDEFAAFREAFSLLGHPAKISDVRNLTYRGGRLYDGDFPIDVVYRRLVSSEMMEILDACGDFVAAYREGAILTVGSFRSQVAHNKTFFEVLRHPATQEMLTREERQWVEAHIPLTRTFSGDPSLLQEALRRKDALIFKPTDRNAGSGVYTGRSMREDAYAEAVRSDFGHDYIMQEFVPPKPILFPEWTSGGWRFEPYRNMIGLFSYAERFAGVYARMGRGDIIGASSDYIAAPGLRVEGIAEGGKANT